MLTVWLFCLSLGHSNAGFVFDGNVVHALRYHIHDIVDILVVLDVRHL